jgi:uncharacterized protein
MTLSLLAYPASILMGLTLGLIGGGGSILTVPILVYFFGVSAWQSTTYSLAIVGISALWGAVAAYKNSDLDLRKGIIFGIPSLIGVYLVRAFLMPLIPVEFSISSVVLNRDTLVLSVFAMLMLGASWSMLKKNNTPSVESSKRLSPQKSLLLLVEGLVVGAITGFVGAGGGFLIIPALLHLAQMPMRLAVGTSLMIIAMKSLLGLLGDISTLMSLNFSMLLNITLLSLVGMFLGSHFRKKVPQDKLKKFFGIFVLITGTFILLKELL